MADDTNNSSSPPPGFDEYLTSLGGDHPEAAAIAGSEAPPEGFEDYLSELKQDKYGTPGQMLKTAAEGLAEGVAGPLAPIAAEKFGISTEEDRKGRAEENPVIKGGTEMAGLVGSTFIPGGQGALLAKAGTRAAEVAGLAGKAGWIAKAGEGAVRGAVESAIFQGGKELSEAYVGNPSQVADHAIADIGLATVLGGVFGGAFGAAAGALSKEGKALVSQADVPGVEAGDLKSLIAADATLAAPKKDGLLEALNIGKRKSNASGIEAAAKELGLPSTPGMTLDSPVVKIQLDALANSPYTYSGNRIRTQLDDAYEMAESALKDASHSANALSKDQVGAKLQSSLAEEIRTAYAPQKAAFEELAAMHKSIPVEPEALEGLAKAFNEIKEVKIGNTQEGRLVREVLDLASNVKTAEDLTTIRNTASLRDLSSPTNKDPLSWLKAKVRDELAQVQEDSIYRYAKSFPRNDEAGALFASKLEMADAAREGYKPYIKKVRALSEWLGKGKISGTEDVLRFMEDKLSPTDVAKKMFGASKDPEFIKFFQKEFPEQFKTIRDYQRMELAESAQRDGVLSPKTFFKKFNDLEPEVQKSLYTKEEISKINKLNTYFDEAFPKSFNPSGTDHMRSLRSAMESPKGLGLANVRDFTMEKMIQLAEKGSELHNAQALGKATARGWKTTVDATKAVFDKAKELPARVIPLASHRDKLDKLVAESVKNPERLYGINDNNPVPEYNEAFAGASARAVTYLNSLKPSTDPHAPLDSKNVPSKAQLATYHRALDIAQQPLVTLKYLKEGTLTSQDVTSLKTIYPGLYDQISQKLIGEVVNAKTKKITIPYQTKMTLSLFLGQPLDSTLSGQSIIAAQPAPAQQPSQQQPNRAPAYNSVKGLDSLAKGARTPGQARSARDLDKN